MFKKKIIIAVISLLCLCVILFAEFWFVPTLRSNVLGIPIVTQEFLPRPKIVSGYYADQTASFDKKNQEELYALFVDLIPKMTTCEAREYRSDWSVIKKSSLLLEFRYREVYKYTGFVGDAAREYQLSAFDAVCLDVGEDRITLMTFLSGVLTGEGLVLYFDGGCAFFQKMVMNAVSDAIPNPMVIPRQTVDTQFIYTDQLFGAPDSMIFADKGRALQLSDVQQDRIYTALSEMIAMQGGYPRYGPYGQRTDYTPAEVYEQMKANPCLEFRYEQRRYFDGVFAQWYQAGENGEETEWRDTFEMDSVVLILYEETAMIIYSRDGLYKSTSGTYRSYKFGEGYSTFRSEVLSLMQQAA